MCLCVCCRMSALHQAALSGNMDIMRLLLEHGAVVDIADSKSKSQSHAIISLKSPFPLLP